MSPHLLVQARGKRFHGDNVGDDGVPALWMQRILGLAIPKGQHHKLLREILYRLTIAFERDGCMGNIQLRT